MSINANRHVQLTREVLHSASVALAGTLLLCSPEQLVMSESIRNVLFKSHFEACFLPKPDLISECKVTNGRQHRSIDLVFHV